jgi:outer membrane protein assembly factor BamB
MTYMDGYLSLSHQGRYFWLCWDETWVVDLTKPPPSPEEIWKEGRSPPHHIISGALCEDTTTIVVGHSYGNLSALDFDGQVLWSTPVADSPIRTVAATASLIAWRSECGRFGVQNMVDGSTLMNVTHLTGPLHDFLKEALAKTTTSASHGVSE